MSVSWQSTRKREICTKIWTTQLKVMELHRNEIPSSDNKSVIFNFLVHHSSTATISLVEGLYSTPLHAISSARRLWSRRIESVVTKFLFAPIVSRYEVEEHNHTVPTVLYETLPCRYHWTMAGSQAAMNVLCSAGFHHSYFLEAESWVTTTTLNEVTSEPSSNLDKKV